MNEIVPAIEDYQARLNITWKGQNGDLPEPISFDATDADIRTWAEEAIENGIPGIEADGAANLRDFVVERFEPGNGVTYRRIVVRPKTHYGV